MRLGAVVALSFSRYMLGVFLNPTRVVALGLQNHYRNSFRMALSSSFASRSATSPAPRAQKPTVIVIAGPTAVGKSALALELCRSLDKPGEVVSADSVQVYRHLNIGSNKASDEERAAVKHHLIDVIEPNERYTAGRFVREADAAIADMLERHASEQQILAPSSGQNAGGEEVGVPAAVYPVVAGGTPLYLQWFVHGPPDAPPSSPETAAEVAALVRPFEAAGDWHGGLKLLADFGVSGSAADGEEVRDGPFASRAAELNANDWYRLARALEVAMTTTKDGSSLEGPRTRAPACKDKNKDDDDKDDDKDNDDKDDNNFSLRDELYDMRCFFLCPADRQALFEKIDARCEKLVLAGILAETGGLLARGTLRPGSVAGRAIGYRQAIEYLCRSHSNDGSGGTEPFERGDEKAFDAFFQKFGTATRNYAAQQLKWFRKDRAFCFVPVPLGPTPEGGNNHSAAASAASAGGAYDENALEVVRRLATCPRAEYEAALRADRQVAIREDLVQQGKKMRTYAPRRTLLAKPPPPPSKSELKRRAKAARAQVQDTGTTQSGLSPKRKWEDAEVAGISSDNGAFGTAKAGSKGNTPNSEPCHFLDEAIAAADAAVDEIAAAGVLNQLRTECAKEHGHGASFD